MRNKNHQSGRDSLRLAVSDLLDRVYCNEVPKDDALEELRLLSDRYQAYIEVMELSDGGGLLYWHAKLNTKPRVMILRRDDS